MKAKSRHQPYQVFTAPVPNSPDHYVAIKDGKCVSVAVYNTDPVALSNLCGYWIERGATIYRASQDFVIHYLDCKVPNSELAKLKLAVTAILEE
jgi:hypothetical protein